MLDLRGALVDGPDKQGFYYLRLSDQGYIHPRYLQAVPGVSYNRRNKAWRVPSNMVPIAPAVSSAHEVESSDVVAKDSTTSTGGVCNEAGAVDPMTTPSGLSLRTYQVRTVQFIEQVPRGALLALDVGLGKTLSALQAVYRNNWLPFVVVGPLAAHGAWCGPTSDPVNHYGFKTVGLRTRQACAQFFKNWEEADGYFINYELLDAWEDYIDAFEAQAIIIDEAHIIRSPSTKAFHVVRKLVRDHHVQRRLALTATPVVNRTSDLWSLLDTVQPRQYGYRQEFGVRYAGFVPGEYSKWVETHEINVEELWQRLDQTMIRLSRFDVRDDLPAFERSRIMVPTEALDQERWRRYRVLATDAAHQFQLEGRNLHGAALQQATDMASALSAAKRFFAADTAEDLARQLGKLVVFCWYTDTTKHIATSLRKQSLKVCGPIHGGVASGRRRKVALDFLDHDPDKKPAVFVATMGTSGMAMNELSCAPCALFVDLYWVPMMLLQAEGRIHREGQRASTCFARYLIVENSMDSIMYTYLLKKVRTIERVTRDKEGVSLCDVLGGTAETRKNDLRHMLTALQDVSADDFERV